MKYKILIIAGFFIIIFSMNLYSHTIGVITGNVGNVYYSGLAIGETQYQNQILAYLCNEHIKRYYPSFNKKVFLELGINDKTDCKLSFDKYQGDKWEFAEENRPVKGNGLRIRLNNKFYRAEFVLKLLEYGVENLKELKKSNKNFYKLDFDDRPDDLSVDSLTLSKILYCSINDKINSTLLKKAYRNLGAAKVNVYKEYFMQNDKYYFIDFMNNDSIYLEIDQVFQIISDYYLGSIIFDTDSTGYFYNREDGKLSNKFYITNKNQSYYFKHTSTDNQKKKIYFEFKTLNDGLKKYIYFVPQSRLIQDVEEFEDQLINKNED